MSADIDFSQYLRKGGPSVQQQANTQSQTQDNEFSQYMRKPERSALQQGGRYAGQALIGAAEAATMPYNIAATGANLLANFGSENIQARAKHEIQALEKKRQEGTLNPTEQKYIDRIKHIAEKGPNQAPQIDVGSLLEKGIHKATGINLAPEGIAEHGIRFATMMKNPGKMADLGKLAMGAMKDPKKLVTLAKSFAPGTKQLARGFGAAFGLEEAKEGNFGPIATIGATVLGDLIGGGIRGGIAGTVNALKNPKQFLASGFAKMAKSTELDIRKQIIQDFRKSGIQADIGTVTGNNLVKAIQAKLAASGLTGKPLEELRNQITKQVTDQYKEITKDLGQIKFKSSHEAGEAVKEIGKKIRDAEKEAISKIYEPSRSSVSNADAVNPTSIAKTIRKLEQQAKPGTLKATDQKSMLKHLQDIKADIYDANGQLKPVKIKDLVNIKRALHDIIDFETQGGAKNSLKLLLTDIDKLLQGYGSTNKAFGRSLNQGNKMFIEHVKKFREGPMAQFLKENSDPAQIMNKMGSINGIRKIGNALSGSAEGKELFKQLKAMKLEELIGSKMVDSTTNQLKHGTFSKLLKTADDKAIIGELLGNKQLAKLERLQNLSGQLAESANKFLNTSQTFTTAADTTALMTLVKGVGAILTGNPWPILKSGGLLAGSKQLTKMIADPEFLKLVEEAVLSRGNPKQLSITWPKILQKAKELGWREAGVATKAVNEQQR